MKTRTKQLRATTKPKTALGHDAFGGGCRPRKKFSAAQKVGKTTYFGYGNTEKSALKNLQKNIAGPCPLLTGEWA